MADGRAVTCFESIFETAAKGRWLLDRDADRDPSRDVARGLICEGNHIYEDRLQSILDSACVASI
jgi:hypothetical protein